jgi:small subunit ribosomal protein S13
MIYVFKTKLNINKNVSVCFLPVIGLGRFMTKQIIALLGIKKSFKLRYFNKDMMYELRKLENEINYKNIELETKRKVYLSIRVNKGILSYKGFRHNNGLPMRGQRTHTNAKTQAKLYRIRETYFSKKGL